MSTADPDQPQTPTDPAAAPGGPSHAVPSIVPPSAAGQSGRGGTPTDDPFLAFELTEHDEDRADLGPTADDSVPAVPDHHPTDAAAPPRFGAQNVSQESVIPDEVRDFAEPIDPVDPPESSDPPTPTAAAEPVFPPELARPPAEPLVDESAAESPAGGPSDVPANHLTAAEWLAAEPAADDTLAAAHEPPASADGLPAESAELSDLWVSSGREGDERAAVSEPVETQGLGLLAADAAPAEETWADLTPAGAPAAESFDAGGAQDTPPIDTAIAPAAAVSDAGVEWAESPAESADTEAAPADVVAEPALTVIVDPATAIDPESGEPVPAASPAEVAAVAAAAEPFEPAEPATAAESVVVGLPAPHAAVSAVTPVAEWPAAESTVVGPRLIEPAVAVSTPRDQPSTEPSPAVAARRTVAAPVVRPPAAAEVPAAAEPAGGPADRREFLKKALAVVAGGVAVGVPTAIAVRAFVTPLGGSGAGEAAFLPITTIDAVKDDGRPHSFPVITDKTDAWNKYRNVRVGAVYLIRRGTAVTAFNAVCPHAGCFVDEAPAGRPHAFECPCHRSWFNADGSLVPGGVSPRGLDQLEVDKDALGRGEVRVKFQNFAAGSEEKIPVG